MPIAKNLFDWDKRQFIFIIKLYYSDIYKFYRKTPKTKRQKIDKIFVHLLVTICRIIYQKLIQFLKANDRVLIAMLQTRTDVKAVPCERCRIIRSFIMFVIMLVLLALVAGDRLAYLSFLDAEFFAALIMIGGGVGFIIKLLYWKFFIQTDTKTD